MQRKIEQKQIIEKICLFNSVSLWLIKIGESYEYSSRKF